jgi:hypothetical protein
LKLRGRSDFPLKFEGFRIGAHWETLRFLISDLQISARAVAPESDAISESLASGACSLGDTFPARWRMALKALRGQGNLGVTACQLQKKPGDLAGI